MTSIAQRHLPIGVVLYVPTFKNNSGCRTILKVFINVDRYTVHRTSLTV